MDDFGPFITTISGKPFYLLRPEQSVIDVEDIAYSLARLCRFTGHVREFYSVAQHSVLVSEHVPQEGDGHYGYAMDALFHDAAEAYTGDINQPLKSILDGSFTKIEARIEWELANRLGLGYPRDPSIKVEDLRAYETEVRDVAPFGRFSQVTDVKPWDDVKIVGWEPEFAENQFLDRYVELGGVI